MRISTGQLTRNFLTSLDTTLARLEQAQRQVSSGKRLSRPHDDPANAADALRYGAEIENATQYQRNAERAGDFLRTSEAALDALSSTLQRARELAVQGANGVLSAQNLGNIRQIVLELQNEALSSVNAKLGNDYLFAGTKTSTQPFSVDGTYTATYAGNASAIQVELDRGDTLAINLPGSSGLAPVFTALKSLIDNLGAADSAAVGATSIASVDTAIDGVLQMRAQLGARIVRTEQAANRLEDLTIRQQALLSKIVDLDYSQGVTELAMAETAYRASLAVGGRVLQPSLLDFLR